MNRICPAKAESISSLEEVSKEEGSLSKALPFIPISVVSKIIFFFNADTYFSYTL